MPPAEPILDIAHLGHLELLTPKPDESLHFFVDVLGMTEAGRAGDSVYLRAWDDYERYSLKLTASKTSGMAHCAFRTRSPQALDSFLKEQNVVAIAEIDTRRLTRLLRSQGAQNGCLIAGGDPKSGGKIDTSQALREARGFPGLARMDLAKVVTTRDRYEWSEGRWELGRGYRKLEQPRFHVVAYDYGIKRNILRMLAERGSRVTVVPAQFPAKEILRMKPDGVFLSNGPGDPEPCDYAIEAIGEILETTIIPVFGICLGHQLMGLASGAKTVKMKFGHHGANHPVKDLDTGRVVITSQNHGFAVDPATLPATLRATHVSLFDGSLQGFARTDRPAFCFQGHPEASPGPHDIGYLFDRFAMMMDAKKN